MTKEELDKVLELHKKWLLKEEGGKRADLSGVNLRGADLEGAGLRGATLWGANLEEANLRLACLEGTNLEKANLREATLEEVGLDGANLKGADLEGVDLRRANLERANLEEVDLEEAYLGGAYIRGANLREANLEKADLRETNLTETDLRNANFEGANLRGANLWKANLTDVENLPLPDLNILKYQKGKLRAFKLVDKNYEGKFQGGVKYEIGEIVKEKNFDPDERVLCSRGINVATLEWCLENKGEGDIILEVEFMAEDIVAIPYATDGKFRLKRCKVIREIKGGIK